MSHTFRRVPRSVFSAFIVIAFTTLSCQVEWGDGGTSKVKVEATAAPWRAPAEAPERALFPVRVRGRWGYINKSGDVVIKPKWAGVDEFAEGRGRITVMKNYQPLYGFIDTAGNVVITPRFTSACLAFSEGLCAVSEGGDYGFIDTGGDYKIKPQFEYADDFRDGRALVNVDGKTGYIDASGTTVIEAKYDEMAHSFSEGLAAVKIDDKYGYIDTKGRIVIAPIYAVADDFHEGLAPVAIAGTPFRYGYIDRMGKTVIEPQFDDARRFSEDLAAARLPGGKFGFIDKTGKMKIEPEYERAHAFASGFAAVCVKPPDFPDSCGYIDKTGTLVVKTKYDGTLDFDGLGEVQRGRRGGYIDRSGKVVWKLSE